MTKQKLLNVHRFRGLLIPDYKLIEIIQKYCDDSNIPKGCQVVAVTYDYMKQSFIAKICHDDFPEHQPYLMMELMTIEGEDND